VARTATRPNGPAIEWLRNDRDALLAFYDALAKHWRYLRMTNPVNSQLRSVGCARFSHHLADVNFHSSLGHTKAARNHFVRLSPANTFKDLPLARCQLHRSRFHIMTFHSITGVRGPIIDLAMPVVFRLSFQAIDGLNHWIFRRPKLMHRRWREI
jgi:hypothetical protein